MSPRELDEDDVRVRARPGSRPRTRTRPAYADAVDAMVVGVDRGRFTCLVEDRRVVAMRGSELRRTSIVVGDRVRLVGDTRGGADGLARIVARLDRTTVLRRTADDDDPTERVIVANADQLGIVVALADPPPRLGFIDRCLVAAYDGGLAPLLLLTKSDLADPRELTELYTLLDVPIVTMTRGDDVALAELGRRLDGRVSVLVGHSGVGKSTLVNRLVPDADRRTAEVTAIGRGRHTSTSVVAVPLPDVGWIIDTPGVRSFGLAHVTPQRVLAAFPDLAAAAEECPPSCRHEEGADRCALDAYSADDAARAARVGSFRRLLASREGSD